MKVFVVGGGGREHAIVWKLRQSPRVSTIYCAPGNAGIFELATCVPIAATDIDQLVEYAVDEAFDLVFVAPDDPLALGLVDRLEAKGIRTFGPRANAAVIESSKAFSKELMKQYGIPTAAYEIFSDMDKALSYLETQPMPIVIKADGLALGKGVIIAENLLQAQEAVRSMMADHAFGSSGNTIVIEECMTGPELTVLAFADGKTVVPMITSRDHKRALNQDKGKNTGGMGAITPGADLSQEEYDIMMKTIFQPTMDAMSKEGRPFSGVIYFGLMLTSTGSKVIEFNARLGDPEAQAVLPRLENDLVDIMDACIDGTLDQVTLRWQLGASCCVVMASGGYPDAYETGREIKGIEAAQGTGTIVFQGGTRFSGHKLVTAGGRVLSVYAHGPDLPTAIAKAYEGVAKIYFEDMHYRTDIGQT